MSDHKFTLARNFKIIVCACMVLFISGLALYSIILSWKIECMHPERLIIIPKGASAGAVAELLDKESCLENQGIFKLALIMTMKSRSTRPGRYNLKGISSIGQLVQMITSQSADRIKVTMVEGWTVEQFADELKDKLQIDSFEFIRLSQDDDFIHTLNLDTPSLEGFLSPDTYILLKTYTEEEILRILVNQYKHNRHLLLKDFTLVHPMNMREITVLASIIQGEAVHNDEMPIISSVYHNRLNNNMLLQADPTIQYIIPGKPRRLYNKDLDADSPYNTYKYKGLPPGPINNPGMAALKAAIMPAETDYIYFVSNGEGRHIFTRTAAEHNQAKLELKRKRRMKGKM